MTCGQEYLPLSYGVKSASLLSLAYLTSLVLMCVTQDVLKPMRLVLPKVRDPNVCL